MYEACLQRMNDIYIEIGIKNLIIALIREDFDIVGIHFEFSETEEYQDIVPCTFRIDLSDSDFQKPSVKELAEKVRLYIANENLEK